MKKIIISLLLAALLTALCACNDSGKEQSSANDTDRAEIMGSVVETEAEDTYTFDIGGASVYVGENMADVLPLTGEPKSYFESESCAFQGLDKVYTYSGYTIRTYPDGQDDYVLSIELRDDTVSTPEGVYIGDAESDVISAYGNPDEKGDGSVTYYKGGTALTFIVDDDGCVSAITYTEK